MMVVSQDMPPHTGATRRWTAALQLDGQAVLTDSGGTLPKASYEDLLGWVAAGELTDIGLRAVEDGMWVDPPIEVLEAAQVLRQNDHMLMPPPPTSAFAARLRKIVSDRMLMPPPPASAPRDFKASLCNIERKYRHFHEMLVKDGDLPAPTQVATGSKRQQSLSVLCLSV